MPRLEMRTGKQAGKSFDLTQPVILGRGDNVGIRVPDVKASREHCRVFQQAGKWVVADLNSRNGITVNGAKTTRKELVSGDQIAIGETVLAFVDEAAAGRPAGARPEPGESDVDEIDLDAPAPAPRAAQKSPAPRTAPPAARPGARPATRPAARAAAGPARAAGGGRSKKDAAFAAAREDAARRAARSAGGGARGGAAGGGAETGLQVSDRVLQFSKVDTAKAGSLGMDLSQYPVTVQIAIVCVGLAAAGVVIWLIFRALGVSAG